MPYIQNYEDRGKLNVMVKRFTHCFGLNFTGHLNYFLFKLAKTQCKRYSDYAAFIGELEAAKLEIYRRLIAPYEDKKIEENGDVE